MDKLICDGDVPQPFAPTMIVKGKLYLIFYMYVNIWMYEQFFWNRPMVNALYTMGLPETNDLFVIIGGERSYSSDGELGYGCHDYSVVCNI
jgi:hypothetical protein